MLHRSDGAPILDGVIYGDEAGRFDDGVSIYTSRLETPEEELVEGGTAQTLNTLYTLGRRLG